MTQRPRERPELAGARAVGFAAASPDLAPADVRASVLGLVDRFLPHEAAGVKATWGLRVGAAPFTIRVRQHACFVAPGEAADADARLQTDVATWAALASGREDGVRAFMQGRLGVRGDLNLALRLETLFRPGPDSTRITRTVHTLVKGVRIESLVAGVGTPVVLLHGLGASKLSFLPTFDGLAGRFEVHALDLPGFGKSDKPLPSGRRYTARWMADIVHGYLVRNRLRAAYLVGNSMGGRIATEVALRHPRAVGGTVGLSPAVAFDEWQWLAPALRLLRGQWIGLARMPIRRDRVEAALADLFHDPSAISEQNLRAAADEFLNDVRSHGYRLALLACARHLATDRAAGRRSYWSRLADLDVPSYWIWGRSDGLVSPRYADRVRAALPRARVEVWDGIGHVPQFEDAARTNAAITGFIESVEAARRR